MTSSKEEIHYLSIHDFEIIFDQLATAQQEYSEDLPQFNTRYFGRLESIISQVQSTYFGQELYTGFIAKAAIFFYLINKDHPFVNGNKRISVVALYEFIERNVSELFISEDALSNDLFEMAIKTASSLPDDMEETINYLEKKINSFIVTL